MQMLQIEVLGTNGRLQAVRQQVIDVPVKFVKRPAWLERYYRFARIKRAAKQHKPAKSINTTTMPKNFDTGIIIASQYRHSAGPAYYDSKKHGSARRYQKPDDVINKEQRARRHHKYQVVDYE